MGRGIRMKLRRLRGIEFVLKLGDPIKNSLPQVGDKINLDCNGDWYECEVTSVDWDKFKATGEYDAALKVVRPIDPPKTQEDPEPDLAE